MNAPWRRKRSCAVPDYVTDRYAALGIGDSPEFGDCTVAGVGHVPVGAQCGRCGHLAGRHSGLRCTWCSSNAPCRCRGLLWNGKTWTVE